MSVAYFQRVEELIAEGRAFVSVTVVDTSGSVPQDVGAKMLVDHGGRIFGTVGGGKVEGKAIKEAQDLLGQFLHTGPVDKTAPGNGGLKTRFCDWNLQKDVGMTCGGSVRFFFEIHNVTNWTIVVFGAGHCAAALTFLLSRLDCSIICVDHRSDWLEKIPPSSRLLKVQVDSYLDYVERIPQNAFVLLMTMGHSTDKPILLAILRRFTEGLKSYPYLGVIGSQAKAHKLHQDIIESGLEDKYPFYCPIGLPIGSNDPQEIAVSVAAQLLEERDKYFSSNTAKRIS